VLLVLRVLLVLLILAALPVFAADSGSARFCISFVHPRVGDSADTIVSIGGVVSNALRLVICADMNLRPLGLCE
jgi:hypothetical protein